MRNISKLFCHTLVCTAFHGPRPEGYECDHINGNNMDWSASNLRWVTKMENIRCGRYLKRLRKHGIDPKRVKHFLLLALYSLSWEDFEKYLRIFDRFCAADPSPLSDLAIEVDMQRALIYV